MQINDYDIEEIANNLDFKAKELQNIGNNILLTNEEIEVLNRYNINYKKCLNLKEIIREIEDIIEESDDTLDDLEYVSEEIAERDYYQNTNK